MGKSLKNTRITPAGTVVVYPQEIGSIDKTTIGLTEPEDGRFLNITLDNIQANTATIKSTTITGNLTVSGKIIGGGISTPFFSARNDYSVSPGNLTIGSPVYVSSSFNANIVNVMASMATGSSATVQGLISDSSITYGTIGNIQVADMLTAPTASWDIITGESGGLTLGNTYYLDPANAGRLTSIAPTTTGQTIIIVGSAVNTTTLLINIQEPLLL